MNTLKLEHSNGRTYKIELGAAEYAMNGGLYIDTVITDELNGDRHEDSFYAKYLMDDIVEYIDDYM